MLIVVACGKQKRPGRHPIGQLYVGGYFKDCRDWAESVTPGRWLIISSFYGLRHQGDMVDSYDMRLGDQGAVATSRLIAQATALGVIYEREVYLAGGDAYRQKLLPVWPHLVAPFGIGSKFDDCRFGWQRHHLQHYRGRLP